jgi:hypothetical protein
VLSVTVIVETCASVACGTTAASPAAIAAATSGRARADPRDEVGNLSCIWAIG